MTMAKQLMPYPEHLHTMIEQLIPLRGCRGCGLMGFDAQLRHEAPARVDLPGLEGVPSSSIADEITAFQR
jgi:hypothetical protein